MASQISSLQSITNTASSTSLSPSLANLNGLSSPKPQAQLRRMTTSVLPPPTSLNLVLLIDHIFLLNRHLTASHSLNLSMDTLGTPQDHPGGHRRPFVTSSLTEDSQMIATLETTMTTTTTTTTTKNIHGHAAAPPRLRRSRSSRRTSQTASIPSSVPR
jgi:hypothetical protein